MAPLELEGDTLGEKHKNYNKLVSDTSSLNPLQDEAQHDDMLNLLNIDIATKHRNIDYILEALKSEDGLYVSKAIKRSTWLVTDPQYAYIINPEYLYTNLYPQMTSKAFNKLMLSIRLHLRDEKRVEEFYIYIKTKKDVKIAYKWLQHCSVPFVESEILKSDRNIPDHIALRLFEKSFTIFETYHKKYLWLISESRFLIKGHLAKYLDFVESVKDRFYFSFSAKDTAILMKLCPDRILDKFELYGTKLHTPTFARYLNKKEDIQKFLLKYVNKEKFKWLFKFDNIQHFIKLIPKETKFEFVKKIFIDKELVTSEDVAYDDECLMSSYSDRKANIYQWYKFAPFELAFTDLKKLIRAESSPDQRTAILQVLISCAGRNMQHIQTVLQFYCDKHINEPFKFKTKFVGSFVSKVDVHSLDDPTWANLNQLFHSMEVFIESENNVQSSIEAIIVRNTIRNEPVPDVVENKFVFNTLKSYEKKLKNQEQKDAVFKYLLNYATKKGNLFDLTNETEFNDAVMWCEYVFNLIKDWGKELQDYPAALARIKELILIKQENKWNRDFSALYNTKKIWRRTLFEYSIVAMQNEAVCVNALKHDQNLLSRNKDVTLAMCFNDNISLRKLLRKMRIYWPSTLANDWKNVYQSRLSEPNGHKALVNGLCYLSSQQEINDLLKKYSPSATKIDWNDTDQLELSLRKQIAKNIHKARPLVAIDGILPYAKGDYLQYVVPTLNSILSQLSPNKSRLYVPTLLDAPVSLQKFGVRFAFHKLPFEELKPMLFEIWNSTKNSSIRTVLFTHTYDLLCKEKKEDRAKAMWELLSMFIDNLSADENKLVYTKLSEVSNIPDGVKPQFFMKSYNFLNSLPAKCNCEGMLDRLQCNAEDIMESLDNDFVINILLKKFFETFTKQNYIHTPAGIIATFILASKDEETQMKRYEMCLVPLLEKYLPLWETIVDRDYRVKGHIQCILEKLSNGLAYTFKKKMQIPVTVFKTIQNKLENTLDYHKNYVLLTFWKLTVDFVKVLDETGLVTECYKTEADDKSDDEKNKRYTEIHKQLSDRYAKRCVENLKIDLNRFGPSVYSLFGRAFVKFFDDGLSREFCGSADKLDYAIRILRYNNDKGVWLMALKFLKKELEYISDDNEKKKCEEIRSIVFSHPSDEVKMHFYYLFADKAPYTF